MGWERVGGVASQGRWSYGSIWQDYLLRKKVAHIQVWGHNALCLQVADSTYTRTRIIESMIYIYMYTARKQYHYHSISPSHSETLLLVTVLLSSLHTARTRTVLSMRGVYNKPIINYCRFTIGVDFIDFSRQYIRKRLHHWTKLVEISKLLLYSTDKGNSENRLISIEQVHM